jgi:hypothetical protein
MSRSGEWNTHAPEVFDGSAFVSLRVTIGDLRKFEDWDVGIDGRTYPVQALWSNQAVNGAGYCAQN